MNMFRRFKRWISPLFSSIEAKEDFSSLGGIERSQAASWRKKMYGDNAEPSSLQVWYDDINKFNIRYIRLDKIAKLNEEIKNIQLSIIMAKRNKKKSSHLERELRNIKAEILKLGGDYL